MPLSDKKIESDSQFGASRKTLSAQNRPNLFQFQPIQTRPQQLLSDHVLAINQQNYYDFTRYKTKL